MIFLFMCIKSESTIRILYRGADLRTGETIRCLLIVVICARSTTVSSFNLFISIISGSLDFGTLGAGNVIERI